MDDREYAALEREMDIIESQAAGYSYGKIEKLHKRLSEKSKEIYELKNMLTELAGVRDVVGEMIATRKKRAKADWAIFRTDREMIEAFDNLSDEAKEWPSE